MFNNNPQLQAAFQFHQNRQYLEAENAYKNVLNTTKQLDPSICVNLVDALNQQGKVDESLRLIEKYIVHFPTNTQLKYLLCQTYLGKGEIKKAKENTERLIHNHPEMGEAHYLMGNIYMQGNDFDGAFTAFSKAVTILPQFAEAHYNLGVLYHQRGESLRAEEKWNQALTINPGLLPALLNLGNLSIELNHYEKAIEYLNKVLTIDPMHFSAIKMIGMANHALGKVKKALSYYNQIYNESKPSEEVLILIANAYRDLDNIDLAERYYSMVLQLDPESKTAKENLEKISSSQIESWHFNMLSDLARNDGYATVINRLVKKDDIVLDIGTGSGLLSMMAVRAGAKKVFSCEAMTVIAETAEKVIADNNLTDQIKVINARSNKLIMGEDLPEKADVLVSEILDAGLLGEAVLPSIRHAQANLIKEKAKVIPAGATVKGILFESNHFKSIAPLKDISGFDLSSFGKFQRTNVYQQAILKNIPHKNLSNEFGMFSIDFSNLPKATSPEEPNIHQLSVEIIEDGEIHGVAFWFDLHLDEELTLSSGPNGEMVHWGQAIYCFPKTKKVKKGEVVTINAEQSEMKIIFSYSKEW